MTIAYGYGGFAPASPHQNVRKTWDKLLHEQVINLSAWKGLTGVDKGGEGDPDSRIANKPIVQKTQLNKESGDVITMGLVASNITTATWYNDGKSGNTPLVDHEATLTLYNTKVRVAHQRFGIEIDGKMTLQKTPYDLLLAAKDNIAQLQAHWMDSSIFFTIYGGFSPNVFRELGITTAPPTNNPNLIFGKGQSALTGVTASDVLDTDALEIVRVFGKSRNINPIMVDGNAHLLLHASSFNIKTLRADSAWIDANAFAMPRGSDNPIFENMDGKWAGLVVRESNKVDTAKNYAGLTVSSDVITLAADTVGAGINATDVYMCALVGANAVARAYALESYMTRRKEDDYENIFGFAGGSIYGDRRADWALSADTGTDGAVKNQSSAVCYFHAPTITLPSIW